ncbi:putative protein of unknown function [Pseudozyma hubeiensis SY62]|uniref:PSP1 C-terminal domain-containing protein n=1 Tax=Pseudozyma hubeiensis (strain SY62) TaxID=1305764 RepID=R9P8W4_PSEHS|nr:putative protein of unknown function [Pseudozyma hubeiensis SY62]GAC97702.1 putative protein of unknown function [Pseudozyma hubeiensis SY62]
MAGSGSTDSDHARAVQISALEPPNSTKPHSTARQATYRHGSLSSSSSSPSPSNHSHPASPNEDDARHGTSPATSVDGASLPPSGLKLDLSANSAHTRHEQQASLARAGVARSPHPLDSAQEARSSLASRSGGMLATMQEEGFASSGSRRGSTMGFDANQTYSHMEQSMPASRHRSASSAAALTLHGSGGPFVDRWASNASGRIAPASAIPSRTIWEGSSTEALANNAGASGGVPQRPLASLQRGFSASFVRNKQEPASPSSFLSSPAGFHDLGFDFSDSALRTSRTGFHTTSSPFGATSDLPELSSYPEITAVPAGDQLQRPAAGTESRRHSVADMGPNREAAGVIGGHRRAIGFDVDGRYSRLDNGRGQGAAHSMSQQGAWPRGLSHGRDRSVSSVLPLPGFNPLSGSSLALSMDDLADEVDPEPASPTHTRHSDTLGGRGVDGSYGTSMPSEAIASRRGFGSFDTRSIGLADMAQTRDGRSGRDSLSASWDLMATSHMTARSPGEGQRTLAEMTRQLRQMSIGEGDLRAHAQARAAGVASIFDGQAEGTRTVRASPGTSPTDVRGDPAGSAAGTGRGLSAQAKSFTASQPFASMQHNVVGGVDEHAYAGPGDMPVPGFPGRIVPQMAATPAFFPPSQQQHLSFNPTPSATSFGLGALALSLPSPTNDVTFLSLAALGPMPPSSMGPPVGMMGGGAASGPLSSAGTTGEMQDLGKGVPLTSLAKETPLYIVEFKQGRTDLFFRSRSPSQSPSNRDGEPIRRGDLVIVEADRGKDLGTVVNDSITVEQVQAFLAHQSDLTIGAAVMGAADRMGGAGAGASTGSSDETSSNASARSGSPSSTMGATAASGGANASAVRPMRTINPKRLFTKATAADTSTLYSKAQDEERALQLCISKVMQRGLPMSVVAAEMQWDRRKLTFYYTATMRVDFRDLVKELFRLYKTRIWMCHLGHPSGAGMG